MEMIALLCPALLSVKIKYSRNNKIEKNIITFLIEWGIYVLINVFCTGVIITYVLGIADIVADALNSFPFFTKYLIIAVILAAVVPYIEELVGKYLKVSFKVKGYEEKIKKDEKDC